VAATLRGLRRSKHSSAHYCAPPRAQGRWRSSQRRRQSRLPCQLRRARSRRNLSLLCQPRKTRYRGPTIGICEISLMSRMPSFHLSRTLRRATAFLGPFYLRQEHPPYIHRISTERKDGYATHAVLRRKTDNYTRQRPKSVENCGADIELKTRSQPRGTPLS
jgi:hypothetical protein